MDEVVKLHISCHCGNAAQDVNIEKSALPFEINMCHCDSCRYTSGQLSICDVFLPPSQQNSPSVKNLTEYKTSHHMTRYFCSLCGAYIFYYTPSKDEWEICTGVLDAKADAFKLIGHIYVGDTNDGGLSTWLPALDYKHNFALPRWKTDQDTSEKLTGDQWEGRQSIQEDLKQNELTGKCHCGGIEFYITRPNEDSKKLHSPYPDLLIPYHRASSDNPHDYKWWLMANDTKYLAGLCACKSCRLTSGYPLQSWAFIPKANIFLPDGSPLTYGTGSLQQYKSSEGVYREFCKTCGATVFWHCDERPELIDVSAGLLRAPSGVRAEGWLEWHVNRVSFKEEAQSRDVAEALELGLFEAHERKFRDGSTGGLWGA